MLFLTKLTIETNVDGIILRVKNRILDKCLQDKFVEPIFEKLFKYARNKIFRYKRPKKI